jgi:hypothetical protein
MSKTRDIYNDIVEIVKKTCTRSFESAAIQLPQEEYELLAVALDDRRTNHPLPITVEPRREAGNILVFTSHGTLRIMREQPDVEWRRQH